MLVLDAPYVTGKHRMMHRENAIFFFATGNTYELDFYIWSKYISFIFFTYTSRIHRCFICNFFNHFSINSYNELSGKQIIKVITPKRFK